ncbi:MAG: hypothetical protein ABIR18_03785 [Chitinophagaceae bacterium]
MNTANSVYTKKVFTFSVITLFALIIYGWVLIADYLYLDEAHALWRLRTNYRPFASEGRLITGILFTKLYTVVDTITEMKYFRIISLFGWIISSTAFYYFSKKWVDELKLNKYLPFLLSVFCICSSAIAIYIGWVSCSEVFIAFLPAIYAGHLIFTMLAKENKSIHLSFPVISLAILLGVISLLTYQSTYGIFILPFLLLLVTKDVSNKNKKIITALAIYLLTYLIYFFVVKFYLHQLEITQTSRTGVVFDPLKKIRYFFSTPFSQAWNLNLLHNLHSVVSQTIPLLFFVIWLILFIRQFAPATFKSIFLTVIGVMILLALSYLPNLVVNENFSSYRSIFTLNFCASAIFILAILNALKTENRMRIFIPVFSLFLFIIAYKNFNFNFLHPLRKEFNALKNFPPLHTITSGDTVVFIRADQKLFNKLYGVKSYKDEFGLPSTCRDWSPEPLTRQLIQEQQSPEVARSIIFYQFESEEQYKETKRERGKEPIVIDVNKILAE